MFKEEELMKNWTEKSKVFRKYWYWEIIALCSFSDLREKLMEEAIKIILKEPSFRITVSSRISEMGINSWLAFDCIKEIKNYFNVLIFGGCPGSRLVLLICFP